ncbi:phospho-sugar mutase [candidate division WOR-3 bacterium]|nr:phospho-sugar mutase [candidate division WOR-3 bacterium]
MNGFFLDNAKIWLEDPFDEETKKRVQSLIDSADQSILKELFYTDLEFGTGGMRGKMDVGTNRMNIYTVGRATQGLAQYIKNRYSGEITAVIAFDSRRNSKIFCQRAASVFAANGIIAYIFEEPTPTPLLSYAVRYLGSKTGLVITASHNPPEYNGYKVYGNDGCQVVPPEDGEILEKVKETTFDKVQTFDFEKALKEGIVKKVPQEVEESYKEELLNSLTDKKMSQENGRNVKILYSPLHGAGFRIAPESLRQAGFVNLETVKEQSTPDGEFPTVQYPNPEDPSAWKLILKRAKEIDADIAIANDPDADRIGLAVRDKNGEFYLLNGNQTGALIFEHVLSKKAEKTKNPYTVKTIVTSELWQSISDFYKTPIFNTLTGFKYIGEMITNFENQRPEMKFLVGGEESYGYLIGTHARDKDGINAALIIAEISSIAKSEGKTVLEKLDKIYRKYGVHREKLMTFTFEGLEGKENIDGIMSKLRKNPPRVSTDGKLKILEDYFENKIIDDKGNLIGKTKLPKSNVISILFDNGTKIVARPSGTEPKIKFYFFVQGKNETETEKKLNNSINEYLTHLEIKH